MKVTMAEILREELKKLPANQEFHMHNLAKKIRAEISKRTAEPCEMYTDSILRQLRFERAEGHFNVVCVDSRKSIYKKLESFNCE
ncbi:MAG: hypothetical protein JJE17_10575 [Peptostreptococcaceae bacterium]|nr:hypothetical protein [Peptostreptococcaceae bacterium]